MTRIRSIPRLRQLRAHQHTRNASAEDHDVHLVDDRPPLDERCKRVFPVVPEALVVVQVPDVGPALDQPFVPLGQVFGVDGLGIEGCRG